MLDKETELSYSIFLGTGGELSLFSEFEQCFLLVGTETLGSVGMVVMVSFRFCEFV